MPFDGSGTFNRVMNWVNDAAAAIKIKADRHDLEDDNFAAGLSNTLTKDGQSQPTANIPMNGKRLINLGAPTTGTDAATKTYVDTADGLLAPKASPTFTGKVVLPTGAAGSAPLSFPNATAAPTTPADGDIWPDSAGGGLKHRIAGVTYTYGRLEASQTWSGANSFTGAANTFGSGANGNTLLQGPAIELGQGRTVDGVTYIDFHSQFPDVDFSARLLRNAGVNGRLDLVNNGTGGFNIQSGGGLFTYNTAPILVTNLDRLDLAAGFSQAVYVNDGVKSGGVTYTPTPAGGGNMRACNNGGAFTLAADANGATAYTMVFTITNQAGAGAITLSGWTWITGDPLDTTVGSVFVCAVMKIGGYKHINIQKMQ